MKKFTVLESTIIGFFIGVVASTYTLFLDSTGGFISPVLNFISLRPLIQVISSPGEAFIVTSFLYIVAVYTFYGIIAGFLIKKSDKVTFFIISTVLILFGIILYQQITGVAPIQTMPVVSNMIVTHPVIQKDDSKIPEQYFGNEVTGDLNGDGVADVAFIIPRNDSDRGILYYLTGALATSTGHIGTNLLFLGNNVIPQVISITDGVIDISYLNASNKTSTTTKDFFAKVIGGKLEQIVK